MSGVPTCAVHPRPGWDGKCALWYLWMAKVGCLVRSVVGGVRRSSPLPILALTSVVFFGILSGTKLWCLAQYVVSRIRRVSKRWFRF